MVRRSIAGSLTHSCVSSYGGYMSFAAAAFSERFSAAIPQYGFIDNRQMSLVTGDYTYHSTGSMA